VNKIRTKEIRRKEEKVIGEEIRIRRMIRIRKNKE